MRDLITGSCTKHKGAHDDEGNTYYVNHGIPVSRCYEEIVRRHTPLLQSFSFQPPCRILGGPRGASQFLPTASRGAYATGLTACRRRTDVTSVSQLILSLDSAPLPYAFIYTIIRLQQNAVTSSSYLSPSRKTEFYLSPSHLPSMALAERHHSAAFPSMRG